MRYVVDVREVHRVGVPIEANSIEEAKEKVRHLYEIGEVELDYASFTGDVDVRVYDDNFNPLEDWDENYIN